MTRSRMMMLVVASTAFLVAAAQLPADAKGGGNPHATTNSIGWAQCTAWGTPDVAAFATFSGDAEYEPSTATWHASEDWDRGL